MLAGVHKAHFMRHGVVRERGRRGTFEDMLALPSLEVPGASCVVIGDSERHVVRAQAHAV